MRKQQTLISLDETLLTALQKECEQTNQPLERVLEALITEHLGRQETQMEIATQKTDKSVETRTLSADELYTRKLADFIGPDVDSVTITVRRHSAVSDNQHLFDRLFSVDPNSFVKLHDIWKQLERGLEDPDLNACMTKMGFVYGQKIDAGCAAYKPFVAWILATFVGTSKVRKYGVWGIMGISLKE